jgi:rRNA maturation RNase YbeY
LILVKKFAIFVGIFGFYRMSKKIQWMADGDLSLPALDYDFLENWLNRVGESHDRLLGSLTYLFCDDEKILQVNREFLRHDYYTDIITFDYCRGKLLRGDLVISLDTVASNAELVGAPYERELLRVIVHGVLHLCGINDKGPGEREIMEAHEDAALNLYDSMLNTCNNSL